MTAADLRDPAHRVDPRAQTMWLVGCLIGVLIPMAALVVVAILWTEYGVRWLVVGVAAALSAAYVLVVPRWRYLVHRWEVTDTAVYTQRGWWSRERRIAPMSRVQTVDFAQDVLARVFGLASVTVTTASAAGPLRIDGLDREVALRLAEELTTKADLVEGDAT